MTSAETLAFCRIVFLRTPRLSGERMSWGVGTEQAIRNDALVLWAACQRRLTAEAGWNRLPLAYAEHREDACHYYSL